MIMKERLDVIFFQVLTPCVRRAAPQPAARWTSTKPHSCAILTRSRTLFVPKGKYSGRSARPEPRIGLHWHYCAGSMVKFKLGWLVKVRGAFCSVCRGGAPPLWSPPAKLDTEAEPWPRPLLCTLPPRMCRIQPDFEKKLLRCKFLHIYQVQMVP